MLDNSLILSKRDWSTATPTSLKRGEVFSVQLVAIVLPGNRWTCKAGDVSWSVESIAEHGVVVTYEEAVFFHYLMKECTYDDG